MFGFLSLRKKKGLNQNEDNNQILQIIGNECEQTDFPPWKRFKYLNWKRIIETSFQNARKDNMQRRKSGIK